MSNPLFTLSAVERRELNNLRKRRSQRLNLSRTDEYRLAALEDKERLVRESHPPADAQPVVGDNQTN